MGERKDWGGTDCEDNSIIIASIKAFLFSWFNDLLIKILKENKLKLVSIISQRNQQQFGPDFAHMRSFIFCGRWTPNERLYLRKMQVSRTAKNAAARQPRSFCFAPLVLTSKGCLLYALTRTRPGNWSCECAAWSAPIQARIARVSLLPMPWKPTKARKNPCRFRGVMTTSSFQLTFLRKTLQKKFVFKTWKFISKTRWFWIKVALFPLSCLPRLSALPKCDLSLFFIGNQWKLRHHVPADETGERRGWLGLQEKFDRFSNSKSI